MPVKLSLLKASGQSRSKVSGRDLSYKKEPRARLRRQAAVSVVEFVFHFVVVVHLGEDRDAAIAAAPVVMFGEFLREPAHDARNDQRMFRGQKAAIATRRVDGSVENIFDIDFVAGAFDKLFETARRFVRAVFAGAALAAGFDPQKF